MRGRTPRNTPPEHMLAFYKTFYQVSSEYFDGMVITGAPVEQMAFEEVEYWPELCEIMEWSKHHVHSTFHICWAAQAGLYHHYGVPNIHLPEKLFDVFRHRVTHKGSILFRGSDDTFMVPHSRHTTVMRRDVAAVPALKILAESDEAGLYAVSTFNASNENLGSKDIDPADLGNSAYLAMKLPVGVSSLIATVDAKKNSDNSGDNNGPTSTKGTITPSGDHYVFASGDVSIPISENDPNLLHGNANAAPDLENPTSNDATSKQINSLESIPDSDSGSGSESVQAGAYTEPLEATSLDITTLYNAVGDKWPGATFCSVSNDMDQTDNRGTSEKTLVARNAVETAQATLGTGKKIAFAYVLRPMRPKKTGIFSFALPLAPDMVTGHRLIWSVSRSARGGMVQGTGVSLAVDDTAAVFIDTKTGKEITSIPESWAVTVSTYLDEKYNYEPVVLTETDKTGNNGPTSNKGSGGCDTGLSGLALMALIPLFARKQK